MLKQSKGAKQPDLAVVEMRRLLTERIKTLAATPGEHPTAIPGLSLYHRTAPTPCFRASYEPGLSIFVQGRKRILLGGTEYLCDGSSFLLSSIDVPAQNLANRRQVETQEDRQQRSFLRCFDDLALSRHIDRGEQERAAITQVLRAPSRMRFRPWTKMLSPGS